MDSRVRWGVLVGLCVAVAASWAAVAQLNGGNGARAIASAQSSATTSAASAASAATPRGEAGQGESVRGEGTYIVVFREPSAAAYDGGIAGLAAPTKRAGAAGKLRADMKSAQAQAYVRHLQDRQGLIERGIARSIGRQPQVSKRFQHAVNGIVTTLGETEAARVAAMPDVLLVEEYREYALDTDTGPTLIGAPPVWSGSNPGAATGYQGEGVVFGILDSGINFGSPSFAAVDPIDGYAHTNPLGAGVDLGTCAAGGIDEGRCNAKLIGGYDFVCGAPGNTCGNATFREEPGFGDTNGHGSHVASTAAGNRRDVNILGNVRRISGVAPRANIVAFDICYTNLTTGQGLCPNVSAVEAVNRLVADGIVDVVNYSIGGGASPWSDAVSLAFLNAVNAGVYVAASAGNSGPGPNTMGHHEPWVSSTASAQHGRSDIVMVLQVTGPQPVPGPLQAIEMNPGTGGISQTAAIPGTTRLVVSPRIDAADDGCVAYPAGTFAGAIAVVRRGTCSFSIKVDAAAAAGAVAVAIANNAAGGIIPSVPATTIPAFGILQSDGNSLRDFVAANPTATAGVPYPGIILTNRPDVLAASSSRGPAGTFDLLKPDVTAPGVRILAAVSGTTITGSENAVDMYNGTSMASPHQAGSAGLIRQARPTWTPPEIKSALAMTTDRTVLLEDGVTPANPHAGGSGRIRVDRAINAGLVLHESAANYTAANPATGGDPSALNQPNMIKRTCATSCSFVRVFRNTQGTAQSYRTQIEGLPATVTPATVKVPANGSVSVRVTVRGSDLPANGNWNYGRLVLTPVVLQSQQAPPTLSLPIAVIVPPPAIQLPAFVSLSLQTGRSGTVAGSVANIGGSPLTYSFDNTGQGTTQVAKAERGEVNTGFNSSFLTDNTTPALFAADDFTLVAPTTITSIFTEGFTGASGALASFTSQLTWSIYPDAAGVPAGNPQTSPGAAVWSYTAAPTSAGITLTNSGQINDIRLNLVAAGQNATLPAGRYWLVVNARTLTANRWLWFGSTQASGGFATITPGAAGTGAWAANTAFGGLAMQISGAVSCGAPWIGAVTPPTGTVAPGASQANRIALNAAGLSAGNRVAYYCVSSNDPVNPKQAAQVRLTVTP